MRMMGLARNPLLIVHIYGYISVYMDNKTSTILYNTPTWQVLDYLLQHPDQAQSDADIARAITGSQKSAVNMALRKLHSIDLIQRKPQGRAMVNTLADTPLTRQLRQQSNLIALCPLTKALQTHCMRTVLFGSRADGSHVSASDYDLFIVSNHPHDVRNLIERSSLQKRIQPIIRTPEDFLTMQHDEPELLEAIQQGTVLWEAR
jgi:predicted nucleotidyltransferase